MVEARSSDARRSWAGETPGPPRRPVDATGVVGAGEVAVVEVDVDEDADGRTIACSAGLPHAARSRHPRAATGNRLTEPCLARTRNLPAPFGRERTRVARRSGRAPQWVLTPRTMAVKITITFGPPADPRAFERHYVDVHAPLVRVLPGLRAYEYGRALTNFDGSPPDAFWVVSLTFDDEDAMRAGFGSPAGKRTVDDMPNFITGTMTSVVSEVR
jgi:uncharacterized protein (TIGR02118 family)